MVKRMQHGFASRNGLTAAALELRPKIDVGQIQRIDIDMAEAAYRHGERKAERPLEVIGAQFAG